MTVSTQRLTLRKPGRLESHSRHDALAHPRCVLMRTDPDDLEQTMCDAVHDDPEKHLLSADPQTFRLHLDFTRAHGLPKGEITTFTDTGVVAPGAGGFDASFGR